MVIFSSIAILNLENEPESNIKTASDALWWSFVTITTVGYGDKFPITYEGRIVAAFLMTAGVGSSAPLQLLSQVSLWRLSRRRKRPRSIS